MAISVSEVTDVDRRTARRLGMDADKVNMVINVWAEEYLKYEMETSRMQTAVSTPPPAKKAIAKKAPAKKTAKPASQPADAVGSPS
jgi:hypothetical protein